MLDKKINNESAVLSERIDAQLEAYGKISADYTEIITSLEQFRNELDDLKKEYRKEYKELLNDLNQLINDMSLHDANALGFLRNLRDLADKQHQDVSRLVTTLEIYQHDIENSIKLLLDQIYRNEETQKEHEDHMSEILEESKESLTRSVDVLGAAMRDILKDINTTIDDNNTAMNDKIDKKMVEPLADTSAQVSALHTEFVTNKSNIISRFKYVFTTILIFIAVLETLIQLGVIKIEWFK